MPKTSTLHVRMEPSIKKKAEEVLKDLGLTSSEAINMFYTQICIQSAIPFDIKNDKKSNGSIKQKRKSLSGYLSQYANSDLINKENGIWELEARE